MTLPLHVLHPVFNILSAGDAVNHETQSIHAQSVLPEPAALLLAGTSGAVLQQALNLAKLLCTASNRRFFVKPRGETVK